MPVDSSLPENLPKVNKSGNPRNLPSLVITIPSSNALGEASLRTFGDGAKQSTPLTPSAHWVPSWNRQQKSIYHSILSWMGEASGRGCQLFRVDLTTSSGGDAKLLGRHFQELRRRIERRQGYRIEYFKVETSEGNGVLHMVWAIEFSRPAYVDQGWLSSEWVKIHGAHRVWIKRMGKGQHSIRNVGRYVVSQYLAGQKASALVRVSWSWWRSRLALGRAWAFIKKEMRAVTESAISWTGFNQSLPKSSIVDTWNKILADGECVIAGIRFFIRDRSLCLAYGDEVRSDRDRPIFGRKGRDGKPFSLQAWVSPYTAEWTERQGRWLQAWLTMPYGTSNEILDAICDGFE